MDWYLMLAVGLFALAIVATISSTASATQANNEKAAQLIAGRTDAEACVGGDGSFMCLDFGARTIVLGSATANVEVPFVDIMTVEIIEDGILMSQTNRGSQAMGAAIGGLAFGGVGAVIGGLSGSSSAKTNIHGLALRIHLASRVVPSQDVVFLTAAGKNGWDRNGLVGRSSIEKANRFHSLTMQAMRLASESSLPVRPSVAVMDELPVSAIAASVPQAASREGVTDAERRYARIAGR